MRIERLIISTVDEAKSDVLPPRNRLQWLQREHNLPFALLSFDEFEILCFMLVKRENPSDKILYYGKTGDLGRDIVHELSDGTIRFIQCKRYTSNVGLDEITAELAKLATNLKDGRYPRQPDEVDWYIVPELTNPAKDLLEDRTEWRGRMPAAIEKHLGKRPSVDLLNFARDWWPRFGSHESISLTARLQRHPDLLEEFFAVRKLIEGDAESVAQAVVSRLTAMGGYSQSEDSDGVTYSSAHSVVDCSDSISSFDSAPRALFDWPQTLSSGEWLDRPELLSIEERFSNQNGSTSLLLGPPGSGKSAMLARLAGRRKERGSPVLAIKADVLPNTIDSEAGLAEHLRLPALVTDCVDAVRLKQPCFVFFDQLDALGNLVDVRSDRLTVLLDLIERLSRLSGVHIVVSCREFEHRHDARLSAIEAEAFSLELPTWEAVETVLKSHGIDGAAFTERSRELLRTPHHLKLYLDREQDSSRVTSFSTLQELLDDLWEQRLRSRSDGMDRIDLVKDLARKMATDEELWHPLASLESRLPLVNSLIADGVLVLDERRRRVGFRHQSFFEHARARTFVDDPGSLVSEVVKRQDALFVRSVVWSTLNYLRGVSTSSYEKAILELASAELRPHLQCLLIDFLGECETPSDVEERLLQQWLDQSDYRLRAIRAASGNPGWFDRLADTRLALWMSLDSDDGWPAYWFLVAAVPFASERCVQMVRRYWSRDPKRDLQTLSFYGELEDWSQDIVDELCVLVARRNTDDHVPVLLIDKVAKSHPDFAVRILRAVLEKRFTALEAEVTGEDGQRLSSTARFSDRRFEQLLNRSVGYWNLPVIAEAAPATFLREIWPWFIRVVDRLVQPRHHVMLIYRETLCLAFDLDSDSFANSELVRAIECAVCNLAKLASGAFDEFQDEWSSKDAEVVQKLLCRGAAERAEADASVGIAFLAADPRRLHLGGVHDRFAECRRLLRVLGRTASDEELRRVESIIEQWTGYVATDDDDPSTRFVKRKFDREYRLRLFKTLPQERLSPRIQRLVEAETVALPDYRDTDHSVRGMAFYGGVMSADQMEKAADRDLLNLFKSLSDPATNRKWSSRPDIDLELAAREFGRLAERQPHRVAKLVANLPPDQHKGQVDAAISGIGKSKQFTIDDLFELITLLEDRGYVGQDFRADAAEALLTSDRGKGLPTKATDLLERWLTEWQDFSSSHDDQDESKEVSVKDSLLWRHDSFFMLPRGSFWLMRALAYGYIRRTPPDYEEWLACLERHLQRPEAAYTWKGLSREVAWVGPDGDKPRKSRFLRRLLEKYPALRNSTEGVSLVVHSRWLFEPNEYAELFEPYRDTDWQLGARAYGELLGVAFLFGEAEEWAPNAVRKALDADASDPRVPMVWIGLGHALGHEYHRAKQDGRVAMLFENLAAKHHDETAAAIMWLFVNDPSPPACEDTKRILNTLVTSPLLLREAPDYWLFERLTDIFAYCPDLIHRVCEVYLESHAPEILAPGSAIFEVAPHLIDISLRLQRLGGDFREKGLILYERFLKLGLPEAESTLVELDGRMRRHFVPPRRPRRTRPRTGK